MTIGAPLGLLALLGVPALIAIYFLRRRSQQRRVSALFLWRAMQEAPEAGPRWQRMTAETTLLLECLAVIAATLFLADVRTNPKSIRRHTVVILDSSLSMQAQPPGKRSVRDAAVEAARKRLDGAGVATIIATGAPPRVLAGPAVPPREAVEILKGWTPSEAAHPFDPAWALGRELAGPSGNVVFITDGTPDKLPKEIELVAVGEPLENLGFTGAWRVDSTRATRIRLRVANFGRDRRHAEVTLHAADGAIASTSAVDCDPGSSAEVGFDLPATGVLTASLPDDALHWDNALTLVPERPRAVHVRSDLPERHPAAEAVSRFLTSVPDVILEGAPDLQIVPAGTSQAWSLAIGIGAATGEKGTRAFLGPFTADKAHPLLEDVALDGVVWTAGASPEGKPLLTTGDVVLLAEGPEHRFRLNIDLSRSSLARMNAWPILLGNLIDLRRQGMPGLTRHNVAVGEKVDTAIGEGKWTLHPAGQTQGDHPLTGRTATVTLPPGLYELRQDDQFIDRLMVNALDAGESDLRTRWSGTRPAEHSIAAGAALNPERPTIALVLLLALLLADYAFAIPRWRRPRRATA
jgi:hypothetical protein